MDEVIIVGAGIGGLTLGLVLHGCGIPCRIFESAAEIKAGCPVVRAGALPTRAARTVLPCDDWAPRHRGALWSPWANDI